MNKQRVHEIFISLLLVNRGELVIDLEIFDFDGDHRLLSHLSIADLIVA